MRRYQILIKVLLTFTAVLSVSCKKCTSVLSRNEVHEVVLKVPCVQKYTARCGWLSLNYCTFYHQTYCDNKQNETIKTYYIHTDCCEGFVMAINGSCIQRQPGVIYRTTPASHRIFSVDPNYIEDPLAQKATVKEDKLEISGGAYAGIICGLVLLVTIIAFIVVAVLKKKRKKNQKHHGSEQEVRYVGPVTGSTPIVRHSGSAKSPSMQLSISPVSSRMVTAPTSPVKPIDREGEVRILYSRQTSPVRPVLTLAEVPLLQSSRVVTPPSSPVKHDIAAAVEPHLVSSRMVTPPQSPIKHDTAQDEVPLFPSSRMVTPPMSPINYETEPAEEPLLASDVVNMDIPESDI